MRTSIIEGKANALERKTDIPQKRDSNDGEPRRDTASGAQGPAAETFLDQCRPTGLDFIPLQQSRYDLVIPQTFLSNHPSIGRLLDAIVSRQFRTEIEALGGYDTSDTGKIRQLRP
jgi:hypothetical protein